MISKDIKSSLWTQPSKDQLHTKIQAIYNGCYDQFCVLHNDIVTSVYSNTPNEATLIKQREKWTDTRFQWSPKGRYISSHVSRSWHCSLGGRGVQSVHAFCSSECSTNWLFTLRKLFGHMQSKSSGHWRSSLDYMVRAFWSKATFVHLWANAQSFVALLQME